MIRISLSWKALWAALVVAGFGLAVAAEEPAKLNYKSSWVSNTWGGPKKAQWTAAPQLGHICVHVGAIQTIYVAPDGMIYCNAPADEGGLWAAVYTPDGEYVDNAALAGGWTGGQAVTCDGKAIYVGCLEDGMRVFHMDRKHRGHALHGHFLSGLTHADGLVYASCWYHGEIHVLDQDLKEVRKFALEKPGMLAADKKGHLWAVQVLAPQRKVLCLNREDGKVLGELPTLKGWEPNALCVDKQNRLYVADNGPDQNIKIYELNGAQGKLLRTFGEKGGVYAGTPGLIGPLRFNGPTGVGVDDAGNIVVSQNGRGSLFDKPSKYADPGYCTVLESYKPDGTRNWVRLGLTFCDNGDLDPESENDLYVSSHHYVMDWSKPAGQQWTYKGVTINRFKYPYDVRLVFDVTNRGAALMRRIQGKPVLFTIGMYSNYLAVFRFNPATDGEVAIPCGFFSGGRAKNHPHPIPRGMEKQPIGTDWLWVDANGDGQMDADEYLKGDGKTRDGQLWGWDIDSGGDVWQAVGHQNLRRFPFKAFNEKGVPVWDFGNPEVFPLPEPFIKVERIVYDAKRDILFLAGFTKERPEPTWGIVGSVFARYEDWKKGNRKPTVAFDIPCVSTGNKVFIKAMSVADDYVFMAEVFRSNVHIFDTKTGREVGLLKPGPEIWKEVGWVDIAYGVNARRMANGDYVVIVEDNGMAKTLVYRWTP